jgi:hypothetical protein
MEDGRWRMEDGGWKMEDGRWRMEDGGLRGSSRRWVVRGRWRLGVGTFRSFPSWIAAAGFCEASPMAWGRRGVDLSGWASPVCGQCDWPQRRQGECWGSLFRMPPGKSDSVGARGHATGRVLVPSVSSRVSGAPFQHGEAAGRQARDPSVGCAPDVANATGHRPSGRESRSGSAGGRHPLSSLLERAVYTA